MPLSDPWVSDFAIPLAVYRDDGSTLTPLPNLRCTAIAARDGADPGRAAFRYEFDPGVDGAPTSIEEALSTSSAGALIVEPGDRIVVKAMPPGDGATAECVFDGLALDFGLEVAADFEGADFGCAGIAFRCFDAPSAGALMRDCSAPSAGNDVQTDLPAHFNPQGQPNASPAGQDSGTSDGGGDRKYPAFLDPLVVRTPDIRRAWTLPMAARHLIFRGNPDQAFVANPDGSALDATLVSKSEMDGVAFDPADPSTYTTAPLPVADLPISGKDWPSTLQKMVGDVGFVIRFELSTDGSGLPVTTLRIADGQAGDLKHLYLASRGSGYDPTTVNLGSGGVRRDVGRVANQWTVRGDLERYEVSVVLAPGFPMAAADAASAAAIKAFDRASPTYIGANRNAYRLFVFDETGEGHYGIGSTGKIGGAPSLDAVLGAGNYQRRRRPGIGELISRDALGKPFSARLSISTNYAGAYPGPWNGTGTWQPVTTQAHRLLPDRLGVDLACSSPNSWEIGKSTEAGMPYPAGVAKVVEALCGAAGSTPFVLRLTAVIEADRRVKATASRRDASPIPWPIAREVDAEERYQKLVLAARSEFNNTASPVSKRDDTATCLAEASAIRAACEAGVLEGQFAVPYFTRYYKVGDRLASIEGRDLGLRTDGSTTDSEAIYPVVVGVRWDLDGGQSTTLELSDAGAERAKYDRVTRGRYGR